MSIIPLDQLGKCSSADVQIGCEAAIDAKSASFITWAETGAAAAILAASLPDGAGVEAACAAAITSAGLPAAVTGGGYATTYALVFGTGGVTLGNVWRSCVTAISDSTAGLVAAIDVAVSASVDAALDPPNTGPYATGALVGSFIYSVLGPVPGSSAGFYGIAITSSINCTIQIIMSGGTTLGDAHDLIAGVPFVISPGSRLAYKSNIDEGLSLSVSTFVATLRVTFWGTYV